MRGNASRFADKQQTAVQRRAQLQGLLVNATAQRFAQLTVDSIARSSGLPVRECECMLLAEQGRRQRATGGAS